MWDSLSEGRLLMRPAPVLVLVASLVLAVSGIPAPGVDTLRLQPFSRQTEVGGNLPKPPVFPKTFEVRTCQIAMTQGRSLAPGLPQPDRLLLAGGLQLHAAL